MTALRTTVNKNKYNAKTYDNTYLRIRKDGTDGILLDDVRAAAEAEGKSLNTYLLEAVKEKMGLKTK